MNLNCIFYFFKKVNLFVIRWFFFPTRKDIGFLYLCFGLIAGILGTFVFYNVNNLRIDFAKCSDRELLDYTIQNLEENVRVQNIILRDAEKNDTSDFDQKNYLKKLLVQDKKVLEDLLFINNNEYTDHLKKYLNVIRNISEISFSNLKTYLCLKPNIPASITSLEREFLEYNYHIKIQLDLDLEYEDQIVDNKNFIDKYIKKLFKKLLTKHILTDFLYILEYNNNYINIHVIIVSTQDTLPDKISLLKKLPTIISFSQILGSKREYLLRLVTCFKNEKKLLKYTNHIFFYQKFK